MSEFVDICRNVAAENLRLKEDLTIGMRLLARMHEPCAGGGIYLLLSACGDVVYVGQSSNVLRRLKQHRLVTHDYQRMIQIEDQQLRLEAERTLIELLKPLRNKKAGDRAEVWLANARHKLEHVYDRAEERIKLERALCAPTA